jgi:hypothetical protein
MKLRLPALDVVVLVAIVAAGCAGLVFLYWLLSGSKIVVTNAPGTGLSPAHASALSGTPCERYNTRPVAVMLASDPEARPLAGISQADMVFEMPVTPNGITRIMAVFQCNNPERIGSIRSARQDFIPLAQGIDAILAHWGGERDALTLLDGGIIDNVDALKYEGSTFYRDNAIARPHNGFTSLTLLGERAALLQYRATTSLDPYLRSGQRPERKLGSLADEVRVSWPQGMDVLFSYDSATNTYLRSRGGSPEIDAANGKQAHASVVVVMETEATFIRDQYIHVETLGSGAATIWQNGQRISAHWKKEHPTDMLEFVDAQSAPIPLERGTVWVLIDAPLPTP